MIKTTAHYPVDQYWATVEDPNMVIGNLINKKESYFEFISTSGLWDRIYRNWKYYYGLYYKNVDIGMEIRAGGEDSELALIAINHFRSLVHMLVTFTTQNRPAWDTRAINSDYKSMQQAKLGNDILDFYMDDKRIEDNLRQAVEDALIFTCGYVTITWDEDLGQEIAANPYTNEIVHEGDISVKNPRFLDVVYDYTCRSWEDKSWVLVRTPMNKWDLIAKYPWAEEQIKRAETGEDRDKWFNRFSRFENFRDQSDLVDFWEFYHAKTPSVPEGRQIGFVADETIFDYPISYKTLPIYRIVPDNFQLTSFGYSPAFDLQSIQEALNSEYSSILTNHKNLGPTKVWFKTGESISLGSLEPGVTAISTDTKPEPVNFCDTPREYLALIQSLERAIEIISGINSVARGQPDANLKSGVALALIDQKALQSASIFIQNFNRFLCETGTGTLQILKDNIRSMRAIYIAGINNRSELREFSKEDLININRVVVQAGNPLSRTIAGRTEIAQNLLQNGLVKTPEEYLTVISTGQLKPLTDTIDSQLSVIHDENDRIKNGEEVFAMLTDDQALHIKKHAAVLDSTESRSNPILVQGVASHNLQHLQLMMNPMYMLYAQTMGYAVPQMPMIPPGGGPGNEGKPSQTGAMGPGPGMELPGQPKVPEETKKATESAGMIAAQES